MIYFLRPILTYNIVLILAAVIPAVFLMIRIYRLDSLEKESGRLLWKLVKAGIFSSLIAMVSEKVFYSLLVTMFNPNSVIFRIILYFLIVGVSEEGAKFYMLYNNSWNSQEFDCLFDGVVYAIFVSLGFALWENISYVLNFGMQTAVVRALTAIPGHASFGVFMGVFYAASKLYHIYGDEYNSRTYRILAVAVPVLLHGAYDYIATMETVSQNPLFIVFIALLFLAANRVVSKVSRNDRYMV